MAATPFTPNGFKTTLGAEGHVRAALAANVTASAVTVTVSAKDAALLPASGNYTIQIDNEQMLVTAGQGTTSLTVTRAQNGTVAVAHSAQLLASAGSSASTGVTYVYAFPTTLTVTGSTGFPAAGNYTIFVDNEQMTVTAGNGTNTWTVTRGANSTKIQTHPVGATVSAPASLSGGQVVIAPTSGAAISVPCPPGSAGFFVSCATQDARISLDGTTATATNGIRVVAGSGEPIWMPFAADLSVIGMSTAADVSIVWVK